jgi:hypothetical protein
MDVLALVPFALLFIGLAWALWLIFKREMLNQNIYRVITYFIGVIITFAFIGWMVDTYLPQWTAERLENARGSEDVETIQRLGREIWEDAMDEPPGEDVNFNTPVPPTGPSPVPTPVTGGSLSGQGAGEVTHVVVAGDTLFSLARRYGTSVSAIRQRNNLTGNTIYRGQTLFIPTQ